MTRRITLALAPALLASALLAAAATAQPAPPPRPGPQDGPHGGPPSAEMKARHEAMQKQHIEDLKTVLRLRPDQEAALAAFVASHEPRRFERKLPQPGAETTPQRLDDMARMEAEMAARHKEMREALAKFYAALSPDQQKVFDALHRLKGGHGRGHHMMLGGPGGHGMGMGGPGVFMMRHEGPHDD
jgi:periplasmic protein CpxP/Spy